MAKVAGTDEYRVRLWAEDGLAYTCDCLLGVDGAFCKHCVAAGLAWLEELLRLEYKRKRNFMKLLDKMEEGERLPPPLADERILVAVIMRELED